MLNTRNAVCTKFGVPASVVLPLPMYAAAAGAGTAVANGNAAAKIAFKVDGGDGEEWGVATEDTRAKQCAGLSQSAQPRNK